MSVIYRPTGMAREYSPYALNLYIGCSHYCRYCYAPRTLQRADEAYFGIPSPRKDVLKLLEKDLQKNVYKEQILLSFIGDVYCENTDDSRTTREALELLWAYHAPIAVLTKGVGKMLRDLDIFMRFGHHITVGTTLTFLDEKKSRAWEPYASLPEERLEALRILHENGVKTFASFEPTIEPRESLKLIERTLTENSVDHYKIGKINHFEDLYRWQDWRRYLLDCLALLRPAGKEVYYKECLRRLAPDVPLTREEKDPDAFIVRA